MAVAGVTWLAVLTRRVSPLELAAWALLEPFLALTGTVSAFGLVGVLYQLGPPAMARGDAPSARWVARRTLVLPSLALVPLVAVLVVRPEPVAALFLRSPDHAPLVRALALAVVSGRLYEQSLLVVSALDRIASVSVMRIVHDLPLRALALATLLWTGRFEEMVLAYAIGELFLTLGLAFWHRRLLIGPARRPDVESIGRLALPFYLNGFLRLGSMHADKLVVGILLGPASLAAYYLACRFFNYVTVVIDALVSPLLPKLSAVKALGRDRIGAALRRSSRFVLLGTVPLAASIAVASGSLVDVIGGGRYPAAAPVLAVLCLAATLYALHALLGGVVYVAAPPGQTVRLELWGSLTNLGMVFVLGNLFGLVGIAGARVAAGLMMTGLGRLLARRICDGDVDWRFAASVAARVGAALIPALALSLLVESPIPVLLASALAGGVSVVRLLGRLSDRDLDAMEAATPSAVRGAVRRLRSRSWPARGSRAAALVAVVSAALLTTLGSSHAQDLSHSEVEQLRRHAVGSVGRIDEVEARAIQDALSSARRATLDSLRDRARSSASGVGLGDAELAPTPPPVRDPDAIGARRDSTALTPFGYDLFTDSPDGFAPLDWGRVPPDYLVGPGDELVLTVWGDTELVETLPVDREGRVFIKDVGLVAVAGRALDVLEHELEIRLADVYSGLRGRDGADPTTWFDLSVARVRTIQVFVLGEVGRPGAYRVTATASVLDVLFRAGGPRESGTLRAIEVVRDGRAVATVDLYRVLLAGDLSHDVGLASGDAIHVPTAGARVRVAGEVFREAVYEVRAGEGLADVLAAAGGLTAEAYLERANVRRVARGDVATGERDYGWELKTVGRNELLGVVPFPLRDGDQITIDAVLEETGRYVEVTGRGVRRPGRVAWRSGMTLGTAIGQAGGLRPDARTHDVQLVRRDPDRREAIMRVDLGDDTDMHMALADRDHVTVRSQWDFVERDSVRIVGPVRAPGRYALPRGTSLADLVRMAGGLRETAYDRFVEVARMDTTASAERRRSDVYRVDVLGWDDGRGEAPGFMLVRNDVVYVRERAGWERQQNVSITGEVRFPGVYSLSRPGETLSELIERAGGLLEGAYVRAAIFTREQNEAGRIGIDLARALAEPGGPEDLTLVDGDALRIPEAPQTVKVVGEVGFPTSVIFRAGEGVKYYLRHAGGLTEFADGDRILVQRANGSVDHGTGGFLRHGPTVDPGTTIVVPRKIESPHGSRWRDVADVISVLSGAATTIFLINEVTK